MPTDSKFKKLVRARMEQTGETYTQARDALKAEAPTPVEAPVAEPTTLDRIRAVLAEYPDLSYFGFRTGSLLKRDVREKGLEVAMAEEQADFDAKREKMLTDDCVQQVEACLTLLKHVRRGRGAKVSSYTCKHVVEKWRRGDDAHGPDYYVANGAFILAACIAGFRIRHRKGDVNCDVYANEDDLYDLSQGRLPNRVKPSPFIAWLFKQRKRDDVVGDLASDVRRDHSFSPAWGEHDLGVHLQFKGPHVRDALRTAFFEWQKAAQPPT